MQLFVAKSVRLASVDGGFVVLDIAANRYSFLEQEDSVAALATLAGSDGACSPADSALMLEAGVATQVPQHGYRFTPPVVNAAVRELPGCRIEAVPQIGPRDVYAASKAALKAAALLRFIPFARVLAAAAKVRPAGCVACPDVSTDRLADIYERHVRARTWCYSAPDRCLLNSLTLLHVLAGQAIYPRWHFGVKVRPFAAHCWLEDDRFVYGEELAYCRSFTPIMVV